MERWVAVDVSDLEAGAMRALEIEGRKLLVCRAGSEFYALENRCPHAAVELALTRLGFSFKLGEGVRTALELLRDEA